ncbi:MAG: penicillin acylase family protein [Gammaproteobacteria bacterium]
MSARKLFNRLLLTAATALIIVLAAVSAGYWFLSRSLAQIDGKAVIAGLSAPVSVASDHYGIPVIRANTRSDALRALGYLSARDRLFQMDLMRRKSAGRLAEIFGTTALNSDIRARTLGFPDTAETIAAQLPETHRQLLSAYTEGINAFISGAHPLPYEFDMLRYRPEPWRIDDSFLLILGMFDLLTGWAENEERMLTTMESCLPQEVAAFLTPDTDRYTDSLFGPAESLRPARPVPTASLADLLASQSERIALTETLVAEAETVPGSNAWVVGASKTADGRAILANDMHLGLSVPNIWYRCELHDDNAVTAGIILPGLPIFISGSNGHIAWGATNLSGDFLDLVRLEENPDDSGEYKTPEGWQRYQTAIETILIKDAEPVALPVRRTIWGPVAEHPLLGAPVAVHWTVLDTDTHNTGLLNVDNATTLQAGLELFNRAGGPQLNILLADNLGHIAWTLMGKIPKRFGFDGSTSRSWADGHIGWKGYVSAKNLPRQIDPPQGFLVSANDRRLGKNYPYVIGRQFASGYRAYRATGALESLHNIDEKQLFALQLNVETEFYRFYQQLALESLSDQAIAQNPELGDIRAYLAAWDGRAGKSSKGLALLTRFRALLAENVFTPFLTSCRSRDPHFKYRWTFIDTPLQALLREKSPRLLPERNKYRDWNDFIVQQLLQSARQLQMEYPGTALSDLSWSLTDKAQIRHPFSQVFSWLSPLLDMPEVALPGCLECLRVASPHFGASERLVVSPAHLEQGILHMPGGQSGHPLSPHYRDQYPFWAEGQPLGLLSANSEHLLLLSPQ